MDHVGDHIHQGQFSMSTPTTLGGRIHRSWLYGTHLCMVDSFRPCAKRATWRHRNGHFYELDFFCASQSIRKEFQNVTTFSLGISDHWGKEVVLHFSDPCKGKTRQDRKARFLHVSRMKQIHQQQQKLQVEEMRGPSDEAGRKRRLFRTTVEDALENQGIPSSVPPDEVACLPQSDFAAISIQMARVGTRDPPLLGGVSLCLFRMEQNNIVPLCRFWTLSRYFMGPVNTPTAQVNWKLWVWH